MGAEFFGSIGNIIGAAAEQNINEQAQIRRTEENIEGLNMANSLELEFAPELEKLRAEYKYEGDFAAKAEEAYNAKLLEKRAGIKNPRVLNNFNQYAAGYKDTLQKSNVAWTNEVHRSKTKDDIDKNVALAIGRVAENPDPETMRAELDKLNLVFDSVRADDRLALQNDTANKLQGQLMRSSLDKLSDKYSKGDISRDELLAGQQELLDMITKEDLFTSDLKAAYIDKINTDVNGTQEKLKVIHRANTFKRLDEMLEFAGQGKIELDEALIERARNLADTDDELEEIDAKVKATANTRSVQADLFDGNFSDVNSKVQSIQSQIDSALETGDYGKAKELQVSLNSIKTTVGDKFKAAKEDPANYFSQDENINYLKSTGDNKGAYELLIQKAAGAGLRPKDVNPLTKTEREFYVSRLLTGSVDETKAVISELESKYNFSTKYLSGGQTPRDIVFQSLASDSKVPTTAKAILYYGTDQLTGGEVQNIAKATDSLTLSGVSKTDLTTAVTKQLKDYRNALQAQSNIAGANNWYTTNTDIVLDLASKMPGLPQYSNLKDAKRLAAKAVELTVARSYDIGQDNKGGKVLVSKTYATPDYLEALKDRDLMNNYSESVIKNITSISATGINNIPALQGFALDLKTKIDAESSKLAKAQGVDLTKVVKPTLTMPVNKLSDSGKSFIQNEEGGFVAKAFWDRKQYTNGYGTKANYPGEVIDQTEAKRRFDADVKQRESFVNAINSQRVSKSGKPLTQAQFDAIGSLVYNVGVGGLGSNLQSAIINGRDQEAAGLMLKYNTSNGQELPGLTARRKREANLYLSQKSAPVTITNIKGLAEPGNIDLEARPQVKNPDGTFSTVRSIIVGVDNKEVVIPTVVGDKVVSEQEAIANYRKTGEHLGKFNNVKDAEDYASKLHREQEIFYRQRQIEEQATKEVLRQEIRASGVFKPVGNTGTARLYVLKNGRHLPLVVGKEKDGSIKYIEMSVSDVGKVRNIAEINKINQRAKEDAKMVERNIPFLGLGAIGI
jgi:GH24 family phage-related lysozyme (muramidase)